MISCIVTDELEKSLPLSYFLPALSIACCIVSVVKIPFITGILYSNDKFLNPLITVDERYSSCLVSPLTIHPYASICFGLYFSMISLATKGTSKEPGASIKPISPAYDTIMLGGSYKCLIKLYAMLPVISL